jgi:hypothetical protein
VTAYWPPRPCQARNCEAFGISFREPAGVWCKSHVPVLWKPAGNPWATPRCHKCGQPGAYPNHRNFITRPACRDHAPAWMKPYLTSTDRQEKSA